MLSRNFTNLIKIQHVQTRKVHFPSLLDRFPSNVTFSFAYGSAAFQQKNHQNGDKNKNMLDLVLVVENLEDFHRQNLERNKKDYAFWYRSFLNSSNSQNIKNMCEFQRKTGNKVWWHPFIKNALPNGQLLKYGVIEFKDFEKDMSDWSDLYISGRLHKPVNKFYRNKSYKDKIDKLILKNRVGALNTALLTLPEEFTEKELYTKIAGISYFGDARMNSKINMEDKNKVSNIVEGSFKEFQMIYRRILYFSGLEKWQEIFFLKKDFFTHFKSQLAHL